MDTPPRRDRAWSRPERPSAPAWPAQAMNFFTVGFCLLLLVAVFFAGWGYLREIVSGLTGGIGAETRQTASRVEPAETSPPNGGWIATQKLPPSPPDGMMDTTPMSMQEARRRKYEAQAFDPTPTESTPANSTAPRGSVAEAARAHAKGKQKLAVTLGKEALAAAQDWIAEAKLWREQVETLLTSDAGRHIAANQGLIDQFHAVLAEDRPSLDKAADMEQVVKSVLEPLEKTSVDEADFSTVPSDISESFEAQRAESRTAAAALRQLRQRAESLARRAKSEEPSEITLEQAIAAREQELAAIAAQDAERTMAAAREDAARVRVEAEAEALRQQAEQEAADTLAAAEKEKLVARAKSPEIRRYLAVFLTKGYFQPTGSYMNIRYERTTEELPVSFTRIQSSGALDKSVLGLRTLAILASAGFIPPNNWHDRPPWQFDIATFNWSRSDQEFIQRAQDLLRDLGPTLVDLKMLAP